MPVYEYECTACGHQFEEFQKISDKPIRTCPVCKKRKVRKLISQTTFVLKGSGWYVTDYARKGNGSGPKAKKKSKGAKEDKGSSKESSSESSTSGSTKNTATASA